MQNDKQLLIWLIRHGETEWNKLKKVQGREDIELNETGIAQANAAGKFARKIDWDAFVTSPLKRTVKTAERIAANLDKDVPIYIEDDLIERHYGKASGLTYEERVQIFNSRPIEGMEELVDLEKRAQRLLNHLLHQWQGKRIIAVTHGGLIKTLLALVSKNTLKRDDIYVDNCSISSIYYMNNDWHIGLCNEKEHLS
ncbi:putative phosphatase [Scopulibacillus daqui]|uniref:Phosphatase n=1 Tax=Scopulibacillus daqui TaxID=1469162 RepID=A0ABS2PX82_9BACL|nr:histidine phosphatase family protein [Scopulibacillus daqui]MBM7644658.1 putative phosphatase [Scopulibacillus daqui]